MYTTIKTLLEQGKSKRSIARLLKLNPRTVSRIAARLQAGQLGPDPMQRHGARDAYAAQIKRWYR
jgi:transposase